jgi:hypothetical protein
MSGSKGNHILVVTRQGRAWREVIPSEVPEVDWPERSSLGREAAASTQLTLRGWHEIASVNSEWWL